MQYLSHLGFFNGVTPFSFDNALLFDGANDYVSMSNISLPASGNMTLSFWFKANKFDSGTIFGNGASANISIRPTSTTNFRWYDGGNKNFIVPTMSVGVWYHACFTSSANSGRFYINGVESITGAIAIGSVTINQFGRYNTGAISWFDGYLDEVAVWQSYTATPTEVLNLYNSGMGNLPSSVIASPDYYANFNQSGSSIILPDNSGNGYTGTLNNFTGTYWVAH